MHHNYPCGPHIAVRESAGREFVFAFGDNHDRDSRSLEVFVTTRLTCPVNFSYTGSGTSLV